MMEASLKNVYEDVVEGDLKMEVVINKGLVHIFTFDKYLDKEGKKKLEENVNKITGHFTKMNWEIKPYRNYQYSQILTVLEGETSTSDEYDGFVVFVLSHGFNNQSFSIEKDRDGRKEFNEKDVIEAFHISSMVLKPKLFFFDIIKLKQSPNNRKSDPQIQSEYYNKTGYTIPLRSNVFIVRNHLHESVIDRDTFINSICENISGVQPINHEIMKVLAVNQGLNEVSQCKVESTLLYKVFLEKKQAPPQNIEITIKDGEVWLFNYKNPKVDNDKVERKGAAAEEENLISTCDKYGLPVTINPDLTDGLLIKALLEGKVRRESEMLFIFILSHGDNGHIYTTRNKIAIENILSTLEDNENLKGLKVALFINACRGNSQSQVEKPVYSDGNFESYNADLQDDTAQVEIDPFDPESTHCSFELYKDRIVIFSSMHETVTYRHLQKGSFFISAICQEIQRQMAKYSKVSLIDMLTKVQRDIAGIEFVTRKQLSVYESTLTEDIVFGRKNVDSTRTGNLSSVS